MIFIGHSLGGIVIKEVIEMSFYRLISSGVIVVGPVYGSKRNQLLRYTRGIMFIDTPHGGTDLARFASTIGHVANSIITLDTNNLKNLVHDFVPLQEISKSFGSIKDIKFVTVLESSTIQFPYLQACLLV